MAMPEAKDGSARAATVTTANTAADTAAAPSQSHLLPSAHTTVTVGKRKSFRWSECRSGLEKTTDLFGVKLFKKS